MILQWTENRPPCADCPYDHCIAKTPFGRFLITWKSWKECDSPTVDETPWDDSCYESDKDLLDPWCAAFDSVDEAKAACQQGMDERLALCVRTATTPDSGFVFSIGPAVDLVKASEALHKFSREPWDLPPAHPTPTPGDPK